MTRVYGERRPATVRLLRAPPPEVFGSEMTMKLESAPDREAHAGQCPNCGGVLTTNQDGWSVCYSCGYSRPGYAPGTLKAAAVCCMTPLALLHDDPFMVDTRMQNTVCEQWAAANGAAIVVQWVTNTLQTRMVGGMLPGIDVAVAPSRRVLERAVADAGAFTAFLAEAGVDLLIADLPEPEYTAEMIGNVHRRHSMPTSGYDGR